MHKSKILFRVSDVVNHPLRNYKRYPEVERISDVPYGGGAPACRKMDLYFSSEAERSGGFPVLLPGRNAVSWTGSVTKIEIRPNWRYL